MSKMTPAELEKLIEMVMQHATNRDSHLHGAGWIAELDPVRRPSWANALAGIVYTLLLFVIIFNTTARRRFPLGLGEGGSFLVAVGLALLAATAIAIVLTPRKRD